MNSPNAAVMHELILGGQRSGKSRRAEVLAQQWLAQNSANVAVMVATAQPWDDEMRLRIARHQADRAARVVGMQTVEEPYALGETIARWSLAHTLVVVDCLTLWLTNFLMPMPPSGQRASPRDTTQPIADLLAALQKAAGPVVLVGNEIGMGVIPLGEEVRRFVDELGRLNQGVANACQRVTLMVAGQAMVLKGSTCPASPNG